MKGCAVFKVKCETIIISISPLGVSILAFDSTGCKLEPKPLLAPSSVKI